MAASVTTGRALRYAEGSARGLLHHHTGHDLDWITIFSLVLFVCGVVWMIFRRD